MFICSQNTCLFVVSIHINDHLKGDKNPIEDVYLYTELLA